MKESKGLVHLKKFLHDCHNRIISSSRDNNLITTQEIELGDIIAQVASRESRRYVKIDSVVTIAVKSDAAESENDGTRNYNLSAEYPVLFQQAVQAQLQALNVEDLKREDLTEHPSINASAVVKRCFISSQGTGCCSGCRDTELASSIVS